MGCAALFGCDMPADQRGTLERVRGGVVFVGVIENKPWASLSQGPQGLEVALVEEFARELKAEIRWVGGGYPALWRGLRGGRVDLLIGGLTKDIPGSDKIGLSIAYLEDASIVAVPPGTDPPLQLAGETVAVRPGDPAAAELPASATIEWLETPRESALPVVARDWEVAAWGYQATKFTLQRDKHVLAVPPGENAFLRRLDRFLQTRTAGLKAQLQSQGTR